MGTSQRRKGAWVERAIVFLHQDIGIPVKKLRRSGYRGSDLRIADAFTAEVKARRSGEGFKTLARWMQEADLLFLREDRQQPLVCMRWDPYTMLLLAYLADAGDQCAD